MLSNLLIYRWIVFNLLMTSLVGWLVWDDILIPLFIQDQSNISYAIAGLFVIGLLWSAKETISAAVGLNFNKENGAIPGIDAQRVKDLAKVEWLDSISEWLVALGLLGTVIGFSMALSGIDSASAANATGAQNAVAHLMQGMRVALNTTLIGAAFSIWNDVNVRILKTALEIYWGDRMVAYHKGTEPAE